MKLLLPILLLSFGASAQSGMTNFSIQQDNAVVCNTTNTEKLEAESSELLGKTAFRVLYHAVGCGATDHNQTEICNVQVVQAGQCASYHYRWGTTSRGAQICIPKGHGGTDDWNCGSLGLDGHFTFAITNGQTNDVSHLYYDRPTMDGHEIPNLHGRVVVRKKP